MRKGLALLLSVALTLTMFTMPVLAADTAERSGADAAVGISNSNDAPEFSDLPNNWSKAALQNAAENGLLQGYNGQIRPGDNLTRAQMAAVINRAFGATEFASLDEFKDVPRSAWYYDDMAKAVQMGTFTGTGNGLLQPDQNITREDAFLALSRAFRVDASSSDALNAFTDQNSVSSWARDGVLDMVAAGYVSGSAGKLNPKENITRAEFAQLMDNLLKQYITKSGNFSEVPLGNIMINAPGVTLKNVEIRGDLIIGDGVGDGEVTLDHVDVTGRMVVRGGGENSIVIKGDSSIRSITIVRVAGKVRVYAQDGAEVGEVIVDGKDDVIVEGSFDSVLILADHVTVTALKAAVEKAQIDGEHSVLLVKKTSSIETATVKGNHSAIKGEGTVRKVFADASDVTVETLNTTVTASKNADNVKAGDQKVAPGETIVTGTSKSSNSSSGGGGSNNNNDPDEPNEPIADVAAPAALPVAGEVTSGTAVTLTTATSGAKIYFTVNGSTPTTSSVEYIEPITITENTTIKAIAVKSGMNNSSILTAAYTVAIPYEGPFAGGSGVVDDPYKIATAEQLDLVSEYLSANFVQIADIDLEYYVASGGDGYHEGKGWEPIGTYDIPFSGSYNGDGYQINSLTINNSNLDFAGLFGVVSGTLTKINLIEGDVTARNFAALLTGSLTGNGVVSKCSANGAVTGNEETGILAGQNKGEIKQSYSSGSITGVNTVGGLTAWNDGAEGKGIISNSYSVADVNGSYNLGGLVGLMSNNGGMISNCYAAGTVTGISGQGGLIGQKVSGSIALSYYDTNTSGQSDTDKGIPLTTASLTSQASFAGWDFTEVWGMDSGSYPYLQWQANDTIPYPSSVFAGGLGTAADPYEVATAEQLDKVREHLDAYFVQTADIELEDYVASGGVGYHEGKGWEPIGTYDAPFTGNYDGDGYEINGLTLDREENYVGLFGQTESSAILKDISLTSVHVSGWGQTGGLIGKNMGEISSCTVFGTISVKKDRNYGGLLAGMNNGTINDSASSGSVDGEENNQELGGLVGENESNGKIQDCASSASVSGVSNLGGLTGHNTGTIINSDASGSVTASGDHSGGLTGYNSGSIEDSFASGDVASGGFYTGGLTGTNWGEITGCFANGSAYSTKNVVGGLAGMNYGTIRHSYTVALVNGPSRTGGLTGANSAGMIEFCYAASPITTGESNPIYSGGLVGFLSSGTVTASYYDAVTAGQSDTGKGVALNRVEMRDQNSFSGWDFADVWTMDSGSYPYLKWQDDAIPYPPSGFAGGSGTSADPYKVATAEQLDMVRDHLDKHFIQTANINLTDYLASGGAGYNDGEGWEPIGVYDQYTSSVNFTGSYDGDGYTITGLVINRPSSDYQGLFGCAVGAELTDIHLIAPLVEGDEVAGSLVAKSYSIITDCSASSAAIYCEDDSAGGLVGENYGTITNCSTAGTVKCDYANAGGLVGYNSKTGTDTDSYYAGMILNCYSDAEVTYLNAGEQELEKAGGLVGYNSEGSILNCHATGNVTGNEYAGGLIGNSWKGTVADCYATGDVSGISDYDGGNSYDVGGLIGESSNENLVKDCWASGKVMGQNYTGGLVGDNGGACTIESCYVADTDSSVSGSNQVGGLVGYNSGTITKSYTKNTVSGGSYLGGLCGYCGSSGIVEYSYSDSTVTGTGGASLYTAGGLCGSVQYASVHDCYATGAVSSYREVGGLCGYLSVGASVQNCYSTGSVTGTVAVGGLVGTTTTSETLPTVTASFYDQDTSGLSDDSGKGTPLTTIQMITQNSFFGWDFTAGTGVWTMDSSPASYPYLQWQSDDIPYLPSDFDGGTGTAADPYEVATAEQLDKVRDHLDAYFIQTANIDLTDYLSAEGDGYNEGKGWEPIGKENADGQSYRFTGSYDGNGKKISGLIIDRSAEDYIGMFGFTDSTSTLSDIYLIANDVNGRQIVGGLTGSNYGMVTGCRVFGSVTSSITGVDACVGGMIGYNYGGTVEYSYADCIVSSQSSHTGGLIGYNVDNDQSGKSSIVRQCFSAGEVSSPGTGPTGGLIGYNGAEINNCYSVASVNAKVNVGGLAGYNSADGTVSNCYAAGEVEGSSSPGGLIGKNNSGTVINSYYNSITTGQTDTGKGEPLTTTEMQEKANFSGWDFTDVWTMDTGTYPYLQWQGDENIPYPIPG